MATIPTHAPETTATNGAAHGVDRERGPSTTDPSDRAAARIMDELRGGANPSPVAALVIELATIANVRAQQLNAIGRHVESLRAALADARSGSVDGR